jgi:hypothetical protein
VKGSHTKRVEDGHGLVGDTRVGVYLFEDLVDVGRVCLLSGLAALLLVTWSSGGGFLASFLLLGGGLSSGSLSGGGGLLLGFWRHRDVCCSWCGVNRGRVLFWER